MASTALSDLLKTSTTEYRLRWRRPHGSSNSGRTRYYERKHFAEKAAKRYRSKGYEVELSTRTVVVLAPWSEHQVAPSVCRHCGEPIIEREWPGHWVHADSPPAEDWEGNPGDDGGPVCHGHEPVVG
jgi:hypothetical protein